MIIVNGRDTQELSVISYKNAAGLGAKFELTKYKMDDIIISLTDVRYRARKVSLLAQHWEAMEEPSEGSKKSYHKKLFEKVLTKGLRSDIILKLPKGEASGEKIFEKKF